MLDNKNLLKVTRMEAQEHSEAQEKSLMIKSFYTPDNCSAYLLESPNYLTSCS